MLTAVQFDDELLLHTTEICNIGTNRILATKFEAIQLTRAEQAPEFSFNERLTAPQIAGVTQQPFVSL